MKLSGYQVCPPQLGENPADLPPSSEIPLDAEIVEDESVPSRAGNANFERLLRALGYMAHYRRD